MAKQTFTIGERIEARPSGWRIGPWSPGVVKGFGVDEKGRETVRVRILTPDHYTRGRSLSNDEIPNRRDRIRVDPQGQHQGEDDAFALAVARFDEAEAKRKSDQAAHENEQAEALAAGWTRLTALLGNPPDDVRQVLAHLILEDRLRDFGRERVPA